MEIFAISDLHLSAGADKPMDIFGGEWHNYLEKIESDWRARVQDNDVVLIAGDLSWAMTLGQAAPDFEYLGALPGKKVIIRGNHDYWWNSVSRVRAALPAGIFAVQNDVLRLDNLLVFGSRGWTVKENAPLSAEDQKIYLRETERLKLSVSALEKVRKEGDVVVGMMHYPPFNTRRDGNELTELFSRARPHAVVYGHLHGKECKSELRTVKDGIPYYLTSCDQLKNKLAHILTV